MSTVNNPHTEPVNPWYKEFWPWFIILLIASAMTASLYTVYIAVSGADQMVSKDYYKEGLSINQDLAQQQRAEALQLSAKVTIDNTTVKVILSEPIADKILLRFSHPLQEKQDFVMELEASDKQHFNGQLPQAIAYRWHLDISDLNHQWQLKSSFTMQNQQAAISLGKTATSN